MNTPHLHVDTPRCSPAKHYEFATLANIARMLEKLASERPADAEALTRSAAVLDEMMWPAVGEHVTIHGCDIDVEVKVVRALHRSV